MYPARFNMVTGAWRERERKRGKTLASSQTNKQTSPVGGLVFLVADIPGKQKRRTKLRANP